MLQESAQSRFEDPDGFRTCGWCGLLQPLSSFCANGKVGSGIAPQCRTCIGVLTSKPIDFAKAYLRASDPRGYRTCELCGLLMPLSAFIAQPAKAGKVPKRRTCNWCDSMAALLKPRRCWKCDTAKPGSEFPGPRSVVCEKCKPTGMGKGIAERALLSAQGKRRCLSCGTWLDPGSFGTTRAGNLNSHCKSCVQYRAKEEIEYAKKQVKERGKGAWYWQTLAGREEKKLELERGRSFCRGCQKFFDTPKNRKSKSDSCPRCDRDRSYKKSYGVTLEWKEAKMAEQGGLCGACHRPIDNGRKYTSACVDHCHRTGRIRGIICNRCNIAMGICEDDPAIVGMLLQYLAKHGSSDQLRLFG